MKKLTQKHIQCGSIQLMSKSLKSAKGARFNKKGTITSLYGFPIVENNSMPLHVVALVDQNGHYKDVFNVSHEK